MKKEVWTKVCPKCGSKEVTERGMISRNAYSKNFVCLSCGFQSPLFPELNKEEIKNFPEKKKRFITTGLPIFADRIGNIPKWLKIIFFVASIIIVFYIIITLIGLFFKIKQSLV